MGGFLVTGVVAELSIAVPRAEERLCLSPDRRVWLPNSHVRLREARVLDCFQFLVCSNPSHSWSLTAVVFGPGMKGPFLT